VAEPPAHSLVRGAVCRARLDPFAERAVDIFAGSILAASNEMRCGERLLP